MTHTPKPNKQNKGNIMKLYNFFGVYPRSVHIVFALFSLSLPLTLFAGSKAPEIQLLPHFFDGDPNASIKRLALVAAFPATNKDRDRFVHTLRSVDFESPSVIYSKELVSATPPVLQETKKGFYFNTESEIKFPSVYEIGSKPIGEILTMLFDNIAFATVTEIMNNGPAPNFSGLHTHMKTALRYDLLPFVVPQEYQTPFTAACRFPFDRVKNGEKYVSIPGKIDSAKASRVLSTKNAITVVSCALLVAEKCRQTLADIGGSDTSILCETLYQMLEVLNERRNKATIRTGATYERLLIEALNTDEANRMTDVSMAGDKIESPRDGTLACNVRGVLDFWAVSILSQKGWWYPRQFCTGQIERRKIKL